MNLKSLKKALKNADTYEEWKSWALKHDEATGMDAWKLHGDSKLYDDNEILSRLKTLQTYRKNGDDRGLLFTLNEGIHGNMGGMGNPKLHTKALFSTKQLIIDYVDELANVLLYLADRKNTTISFEEKLDLFRRASLCFGRSALMLSGGGQLGNFHAGVLKVLVRHDILPDVISGSSAGSIFAALAGTKTNDELAEYLEKDSLIHQVKKEANLFKHISEKNTRVSVDDLTALVQNTIPDLTFQEAFELTGRKINISVAPRGAQQKSRLLNAIASPNVLIRSAVMASCAVPGVFPPVTLYAKNQHGEAQAYLPSRKWIDGSMSNDLPSKRLGRLYQVNHFIVSMTNPIVLPFVRDSAHHSDFFAPLIKLGTGVLKETTQFNYSIAKRFFNYFPGVAPLASSINSIVQQEYTGDINIMANLGSINPRKLLSALSFDELNELISHGEKATWPKVEAIRITTKIGRILDDIVEDYEEEEIQLANRVLRGK